MKEIYLTMTLSLLASSGCNKPPKAAPTTDAHQGMVMVRDSGGAGQKSMSPDGMGMMLMMQAHIDSMAKMTPEQMSRVMARHERLMAQMMDQMGGEMRQMQMPGNRGWSALTDSVNQDLAELPSLNGKELSSRMQAHAKRVGRLIGMHKRMMQGM